jgi:hypothetical protein
VGILLTGCPSDPGINPGMLPDASKPGTGGLAVEWSSQPATWPSDLGGGLLLERADFAFDSLRVVGDAGSDPRTTKSEFSIRWDDNSSPEGIMFVDAPAGLYSQVSLLADGHLMTDSVNLRGKVTVNAETTDFEVDIDEPLAVTVQINEMLAPPDVTTIKLRVDFKTALTSVDWSQVNKSSGKREIEDDDPQMAMVRQTLIAGFQIVNAGGAGGAGPQ